MAIVRGFLWVLLWGFMTSGGAASAGEIRGQVLNKLSQAGLPGVSITVSPSGGTVSAAGPRLYSAVSDAMGNFQVPGIPAGDYAICARSVSGNYLDLCNDGGPLRATAPASGTANVLIELNEGVPIEVAVIDPDSIMAQAQPNVTPAGGLLVVLVSFGRSTYPVPLLRRNAEGWFFRKIVPVGSYIDVNVSSSLPVLSDASQLNPTATRTLRWSRRVPSSVSGDVPIGELPHQNVTAERFVIRIR